VQNYDCDVEWNETKNANKLITTFNFTTARSRLIKPLFEKTFNFVYISVSKHFVAN